MEEVLKTLNSCIARVAWRLRPSARRRLETDVLCLWTRMRPVVMVDYGGKMPELKEHLLSLFILAQKESTSFLSLRLMVIEDMVYIVHTEEFAEYTNLFLMSKQKLLFIDLEEDPPKILLETKQSFSTELRLIQKLFLCMLQSNDKCAVTLHGESSIAEEKCDSSDHNCHFTSSIDGYRGEFASSILVDLTNYLKDAQITLPTLNGWLLGYPVAYLFGKDRISDAVYNLSTKSLNIFKILVRRNTPGRTQCDEELLSFSVPYDLSTRGEEEPWAKEILTHVSEKLPGCRHVWAHARLEVSQCCLQAIAL